MFSTNCLLLDGFMKFRLSAFMIQSRAYHLCDSFKYRLLLLITFNNWGCEYC